MASRTVRARLDAPSERALSVLVGEGRNESEAVREALVESAERRRRRSSLAAEVRVLAADAADSSERRSVLAELESLDGDWPD
jgi:Arc/MetJ-type ribon-helix-helix transcriptional regulator